MARKQHILIVSLSNIGDVILTTPVIMNIACRFPDAHISVIVGPKAYSLLEHSRHIHRLVLYDKKAKLRDKIRFIISLWRYHYDYVIDLRNTAIPYLVSAGKRSRLFRNYQGGGMRKRHLNVLAEMGFVVDEMVEPFDFYHANESQEAYNKIYGQEMKGIVIAAGSASALKRWPLENYQKVISFLLEQTNYPVFLIGDQSERAYVQALCEIDPGRVLNLAGRMTLRETAALIAKAVLLVTNDSAAMHLGHELRRSVIALFGPSDPEKYGRTGESFRIVRGAQNSAGTDYFSGATAEKVIQDCRELLERVQV